MLKKPTMSSLDDILDEFLALPDYKWHIHESKLMKLLQFDNSNEKVNDEMLEEVLKGIELGCYPSSKKDIPGGPKRTNDCSSRISYTIHGRHNVNRKRWFKVSTEPILPLQKQINLCRYLSDFKSLHDLDSGNIVLDNLCSQSSFQNEYDKLHKYCQKNNIPINFESIEDAIADIKNVLECSNLTMACSPVTPQKRKAGRPLKNKNQSISTSSKKSGRPGKVLRSSMQPISPPILNRKHAIILHDFNSI